ncbi:unnamed protein product [Acanthoscelides obtectus]|uniref:Uncharacterized protein n=1 Tax=Acanthoscelides obtectus TaxID=200917 RepID=A0A9P0P332_ACAOB|nr:unnamed protein product [Acanthoscelides obtectus]CAK1658267.1 hypothetical protein AOBTE_LOCUS20794 [Acanthoscelides obtectus]
MHLINEFKFKFNSSVSFSVNDRSFPLQETLTEMGLCYSFNSELAAYSSLEYIQSGKRSLMPGNEIFSVNPLDGEVYANLVNISSGYKVLREPSCDKHR